MLRRPLSSPERRDERVGGPAGSHRVARWRRGRSTSSRRSLSRGLIGKPLEERQAPWVVDSRSARGDRPPLRGRRRRARGPGSPTVAGVAPVTLGDQSRTVSATPDLPDALRGRLAPGRDAALEACRSPAVGSRRGAADSGIEVRAPVEGRSAEILTPDALEFVASLQREFGGRRPELLAARRSARRARRRRAARLPRRDGTRSRGRLARAAAPPASTTGAARSPARSSAR